MLILPSEKGARRYWKAHHSMSSPNTLTKSSGKCNGALFPIPTLNPSNFC